MRNAARKLVAMVALGMALCLTGGTAVAHHGRCVTIDDAKLLTLSGTVTKVAWINPHVFIYFDVKGDDGELHNYGVEWTNPRMLNLVGLNADLFKPGTMVKIRFILSQYSAQRGEVNAVWDANGKVMWQAEHQFTQYKPGN